MANHRTPDGAAHHGGAVGHPVRPTDFPAPRATSVWTYGAPQAPSPWITDVPADVTAPARPAPSWPSVPAPVVPRQAAPAPLSPAHAWPAPVGTTTATAVVSVPETDTARRSAADDIASRATTTLIPSSPGARQSRSGPVFVDGSGRRARWFKGVAATAATLAAGYVGVVVTGALAGTHRTGRRRGARDLRGVPDARDAGARAAARGRRTHRGHHEEAGAHEDHDPEADHAHDPEEGRADGHHPGGPGRTARRPGPGRTRRPAAARARRPQGGDAARHDRARDGDRERQGHGHRQHPSERHRREAGDGGGAGHALRMSAG